MQVKVMMYIIRSGAIRWQIPDILSHGNNNVCMFPAFTCKNSYLKSLTLKIQVKVTGYNIRNGSTRWQIQTSVQIVLTISRQLSPISRYLYFKICDLENLGQGPDVQHAQWRHSMVNIHDFLSMLSDGNSNVFAIFHHLQDINKTNKLPHV